MKCSTKKIAVVKTNPGVLPCNAIHAQAGFVRRASLRSWGIMVLGAIIRNKAELGDRTAAYGAARCKSVAVGIKRDILRRSMAR